MYRRYFTTESQIVGSFRFTIEPCRLEQRAWDDTLANGKLYFGSHNRNLYSMDFADGAPVQGTESLISPASDGSRLGPRTVCSCSPTSPPTTTTDGPRQADGIEPQPGTITINWAASTDAPHPRSRWPIGSTGRDLNNQIGTTNSTTFTDTGPGSPR